jgi:hypothetical protein
MNGLSSIGGLLILDPPVGTNRRGTTEGRERRGQRRRRRDRGARQRRDAQRRARLER